MEHFYDIAKHIANSTRIYTQKNNLPSEAGCILVHFITQDDTFVKSYFGEECREASYPFPLEENGVMVSSKLITIDSYRPYYCGVTSSKTQKTAYVNHFGLCSMLVATELQTGNSHCDVTTEGTSEISGFAEGYQFHKCATATINAKTTNRPLLKIIVAISSEFDNEMRATDINNRTIEAISSATDYINHVCGEYCEIHLNR